MSVSKVYAKWIVKGLWSDGALTFDEFGKFLVAGPTGYLLSEWIEKTGYDATQLVFADGELWGRRMAERCKPAPPREEIDENGRVFYLEPTIDDEPIYYPINKSGGIIIEDATSSELIEDSAGERWYDVRVIPALEAPNVGKLLNGVSFNEAYNRFVRYEPIARFHLEKYRCSSDDSAFLNFDALTLFGDDRTISIEDWSIAPRCIERARQVADRFATSGDCVRKYLAAVVSNASSLLTCLICGRVWADGFYQGDTRERLPIDAQLWADPDLKLDLRRGALVNAETGVVVWSSIVLRAPAAVASQECESRRASENEPSNLRWSDEQLREWILAEEKTRGDMLTMRERKNSSELATHVTQQQFQKMLGDLHRAVGPVGPGRRRKRKMSQ